MPFMYGVLLYGTRYLVMTLALYGLYSPGGTADSAAPIQRGAEQQLAQVASSRTVSAVSLGSVGAKHPACASGQ